jgi:hypothetical protein
MKPLQSLPQKKKLGGKLEEVMTQTDVPSGITAAPARFFPPLLGRLRDQLLLIDVYSFGSRHGG